MRATGGYMDYMEAGLVQAAGRCMGQLEAIICVLVDAARSSKRQVEAMYVS